MIVLWLILALAFTHPQQSTPTPDEQATMQRAQLEHERHRQAAIQLNELAGRIHSEADALAFVEGIADIFAGSLPAAWAGPSIRQRVAHAEYEAISDPLRLIPEQRIADVWNEYVREIGAPEEALVTTAELYNLRDADFAAAQFFWSRGHNIWAVSTIYALGPGGKMDEGARPIQALRILYA